MENRARLAGPRGLWRDAPIRRKLLAITMAVVIAALAVAGASIVVSDSYLYRTGIERDLNSLAEIVAMNATGAMTFDDQGAAEEMLGTLRARTHLVAACLFRANGSEFARYVRPGAEAGCGDADRARTEAWQYLVVWRPVTLDDRRLGSLVLLYDLDEVGDRRWLYGGVVLGILAAAGLFALAVSSRLCAFLANPVITLARASATVSATKNYGIRVEKMANDETGELVDAFNGMLAGIQSRDLVLRDALLNRESALADAQAARDSLEITLNSIGDAVISTDANGRIVFANPVAVELLDQPERELKGRLVGEVFHIVDERSREALENPVARVLREGLVTKSDENTLLITRGGEAIPINDSGAPIRDQFGILRGTVLVFRDATLPRRAMMTSRLLASIVESSEDAIISCDLDGDVTSWNRGAQRIFGYSEAEMMGQPLAGLAAPGRLDEMMGIFERVRGGERIQEWHTLRRAKDGRLVNVSLAVSPIQDARGRITGISKIARDITEVVRSAEHLARVNADLKEMNTTLARSNEDLERFAFIASHDLQEPLRMIATYSQLLVRKYPTQTDKEATWFVQQIVDNTGRMRTLLTDLLGYAQIRAQPEDRAEEVDLNEVMAAVRSNLRASIESARAELVCEALPKVMAHEAYMLALFQNLVGNALKYRREEPPVVRVSCAEEREGLHFRVADNGVGIEPSYHKKIFTAFTRLHSAEVPGTGIGLAICQRVVERYGGRIWVESAEGAGSTFHFLLPAARPERAEA